MKICSSCGNQNSDDFLFCQGCGGMLAAGVNAASGQTAYSAGQMVDSLTPAQKTQKEMFASPRFLIMAILFAVTTLYTPIANIITFVTSRYSSPDFSFPDLSDISDSEDFFNYLRYMVSAQTGSGLFSSIIALLIGALMVFAFFQIYFGARNPGRMKTAGLSIFKGMTIFYIVVLCIVFAAVLIIGIAAAAISGSSNDIAIAIGVIIGLALVVPLPLLFFIFTVKTINSLKNTVENGTYKGKISGFVGVMCFIMGGFIIISNIINTVTVIRNVVSSYYIQNMGLFVLSLFVTLLNCGFYILLGVGIFSYRNKMMPFMTFDVVPGFPLAYAPPVYYAPPQMTQAPPQYYQPPQVPQAQAPQAQAPQQQPAQQYIPPQQPQQPYNPPASPSVLPRNDGQNGNPPQ